MKRWIRYYERAMRGSREIELNELNDTAQYYALESIAYIGYWVNKNRKVLEAIEVSEDLYGRYMNLKAEGEEMERDLLGVQEVLEEIRGYLPFIREYEHKLKELVSKVEELEEESKLNIRK